MLKAIVMVLASAVWIGGCSAAPAASPAADLQNAADLFAIHNIEVEFHRAGSTKDVDLITSLFTDTATFTTGGQTYAGKDEIRDFFATKAGPFQPQNTWISETPAYKIRATVDGNTGTLYFECHYVDVATRMVVSVVGADATVERIGDSWLMTTLTASSLPELVP